MDDRVYRISNRRELYDQLVSKFGERCSVCKATGVPLQIHHIVPITQGGSDSINNLMLVCPNCNTTLHGNLRGYDFEKYLVQLLQLNEDFRTIKSEVTLGSEQHLEVDILVEERIDGEWHPTIIETKVLSSFTKERLEGILAQLIAYRNETKIKRIVFAFPGEIDKGSQSLFEKQGIEIWDLKYLSTRFRNEINNVSNPPLQSLFLAKKPVFPSTERQLILDLKQCNVGQKDWSKYQKLVGNILETLFCPPLSTPIAELTDVSGVNRRDFILPNYAEEGFWAFLRSHYSADSIVVDAKNYKDKVSKNCVLQISNYLKKHGSGLFGMIVARKEGDRGCVQTLREKWIIDGKMILVLTDDDIEKMLLEKSSGRPPEIIIRQKIEDFRLRL